MSLGVAATSTRCLLYLCAAGATIAPASLPVQGKEGTEQHRLHRGQQVRPWHACWVPKPSRLWRFWWLYRTRPACSRSLPSSCLIPFLACPPGPAAIAATSLRVSVPGVALTHASGREGSRECASAEWQPFTPPVLSLSSAPAAVMPKQLYTSSPTADRAARQVRASAAGHLPRPPPQPSPNQLVPHLGCTCHR